MCALRARLAPCRFGSVPRGDSAASSRRTIGKALGPGRHKSARRVPVRPPATTAKGADLGHAVSDAMEAQSLWPFFLPRDYGRITNPAQATLLRAFISISSVYCLVGSGGSSAYHASKGAVRLLTKSTAIQYASDGIRANSVPCKYEASCWQASIR